MIYLNQHCIQVKLFILLKIKLQNLFNYEKDQYYITATGHRILFNKPFQYVVVQISALINGVREQCTLIFKKGQEQTVKPFSIKYNGDREVTGFDEVYSCFALLINY